MKNPSAVKKFLHDVHADQQPHSGRTLIEHLTGVFMILRRWKQPEHVQLAGLFHSIYGTVIFRHKSWPFTKRNAIQELIGNEAERLAYLFCVILRPKVLLHVANHAHPQVQDREAGTIIDLTADELDELLTIEAANLLEQDCDDSRTLVALLSTRIPTAAKDSVAGVLDAALIGRLSQRRK